MANLLEKASILITPTAYSDGKIHSAKPIQSLSAEKVTNGDFSNGSTDWTKGASWSIANGFASSDGSSSNSFSQTSPILEVGKTYLLNFDLSSYVSGTLLLLGGSYQTQETFTSNGSYNIFIIPKYTTFAFYGSTFNGSIDNISIKEVIDSDLNFTRGSAATRVNAQGLIENSQGNNIPRINYKDGVGSWLIEPQSTNLVEYSESLNSYLVNKVDASITENYGISPNGTLNSSRVQFNDSTAFVYSMINISTEHTSSVYIKGIANETIKFGIGANVTTGELFTLSGDWQRIFYSASSATQLFLSTYGGSTARDLEIFGLQLEQQSFATSYIPTNGSVQTRLAETASRSGLGDLIDSTQGVFYAEIAVLSGQTNINRYISINNGTDDNSISFHFRNNNNNQIRVILKSGNVNQFDITYNPSGSTDFAKVAFKYKVNDFSLWVNGIEIATDTSGITFSTDTLNKLSFDDSSGSPFYGNIKALALFPILTDEELECLTTR